MARDYDAQLIESVAVRRRRLRDALLWGSGRTRLSSSDNLARFLLGGVLTALVCAGCVGWSFVEDAVAEQRLRNAPASTGR